MKKRNRILCCLMLVCTALALFGSLCASALDEFDRDAKCVLKVLVLNEQNLEKPVVGAEVTLYRAADVEFKDEKPVYPCTEDFKGYAKSLESVSSEDNAQMLFAYAYKNELKGTTIVTDETGKAEFTGLEPGVYLVAEIKSNNEQYGTFKPFLAVLPFDDDGEWVFTVTALPKLNDSSIVFDKDLTVKKVWNDDGNNRPQSISVQLLCNGEVLDTVTLNDGNKWMYKWEKLDSSKKYSVVETSVPAGYYVSYSETETGFVISNTRTLIQTGQLRWPIPVLGIGGLALIVVGIALRCSRKENE